MADSEIRKAAKDLVDHLKSRDHEAYNEFLDDETWNLVARLDEQLNAPRTHEMDALWSVRCFQCDNNNFHTTNDRSVAVAWRDCHRVNEPGHDVRLISIIQE